LLAVIDGRLTDGRLAESFCMSFEARQQMLGKAYMY